MTRTPTVKSEPLVAQTIEQPQPLPTDGHDRIRVTAKIDGFRRAGRAWSSKPIDCDVADFTDDQIRGLFAEPLLVIELL